MRIFPRQARPGSRSGELEQLRQRVDGLELRVAALEAAPRPGEAAEVAPQEAPIAQPGAELHAQDGGTEVEGGKKDQAVDMKEQEQEKEKEEDTKDEADRNQVEDRREEQNRSNEDDSNEEARNGSKKEHQEPAEDPGVVTSKGSFNRLWYLFVLCDLTRRRVPPGWVCLEAFLFFRLSLAPLRVVLPIGNNHPVA